MTNDLTFADYATRLRGFIRHDAPATGHEARFNELALALFTLQFAHNPAYRLLCQARKISPANVAHWADIPAVPTAAFKELELTSIAPGERPTVFHSSGTTEQRPSRHFHNAASLALYEASLRPWFQAHLLPDLADAPHRQMIFLTPSPALAPRSSLAHMLETVRGEFATSDSIFTGELDTGGAWTLDVDKTLATLRDATSANRVVVLLGTAFNFLQLLDRADECFALPAGSRAMETGGYKGRAHSLPKAELHALIGERLGIPPAYIVGEYGMSELSSQAYDLVAGDPRTTHHAPRTFAFPPWARAQIVSPETGREVANGETGLLRIFDLANVRSVMAVQTEDLCVRHADGFELLGRATLAEPRGCSLMTA